MIFAVFPADLLRKFSASDSRVDKPCGTHYHRVYWRARSWDPRTYPKTFDQVLPLMLPLAREYILSTENFDRALQGKWRPPHFHRAPVPFIATRAIRGLTRLTKKMDSNAATDQPAEFVPGQRVMINEIHRYLTANSLPALVVHVPSRDELLTHSQHRNTTKEFSARIGAQFVEGAKAFDGLSRSEIQACWLPSDGHWNQIGSDRFAEFMVKVLARWP